MDFHPLVIHFPIALLLVGCISDAIGILGQRDHLQQVGYALFALGALATIPAALTGNHAANTAQHIAHITEDLDWHDTLGTATALVAVILTLIRTHLVFKKQFTGSVPYIYLLGAFIAVSLVCASGYTGGRLVYDHGAGTRPVIEKLDIKPEAPKRIPRSDTFQTQ